jgi:hypothetical protein
MPQKVGDIIQNQQWLIPLFILIISFKIRNHVQQVTILVEPLPHDVLVWKGSYLER